MKRFFPCLFVSIFIVLSNNCFSQPGSNDSTFNTFDNGNYSYGQFNGEVLTTCIQPDGKILVGGLFSAYGGTVRNGIARLNVDGTLDTTFNNILINNGFLLPGGPGQIHSIKIQPDGKILCGGYFTWYQNSPAEHIVRLNNDGTRDLTFNSVNFGGNIVRSLCIQQDGKIAIVGSFTSVNGVSCNRLARLNTDGTLDVNFFTGTGLNNTTYTINVQPDGKLLIGGGFTSYNNSPANRIIRINSNGTLDPSFNSGTGIPGGVYTTSIRSNGYLLIGGSWAFYNGYACKNIAQTLSTGDFDAGFNFNLGSGITNSVLSGVIYTIELQTDGKIVVGGLFETNNGFSTIGLTRLNSNGSRDLSFNIGSGFTDGNGVGAVVKTVSIQTDGKIIVGGVFAKVDGNPRNNITRLNDNGSVDLTFGPNPGFLGNVQAMGLQLNGNIIAGGAFSSFNDTLRNNLVGLNINGSIDANFNVGSGFNGPVTTINVQDNGKIIVGGGFTIFNGSNQARIVRLNSNGTLDPTFNIGSGFNDYVYAACLQPDGKIIVGGNFTNFNGVNRNRIIRLNSDGSLDPTFNPGSGFVGTQSGGPVLTISVQSDGKILVGGMFTSFNINTRNYFARLNSDGSIDNTFNPIPGFNNSVWTSFVQPDGKIIIGGDFTSFNGNLKNRIIRLNNDGSIDATFVIGTGFDNSVRSINMQSNGQLLLSGEFLSYNGNNKSKIVRLNSNAGNDATFNIGSGFNGGVTKTLIQSDGKILCSGSFSSYNSIPRRAMARLNSVCQPSSSTLNQTVCGSVIINGQTFNNSGTYSQTITNSSGCDSNILINLTVNPLPTIIAGNNQTICTGGSVTLSATGGTNYIWNNNVNNGVAFTPNVTNTYIVTGTNTNGCSDSDQVIVTVNPLPIVNAGNDQTVCAGSTVTLLATGASNYVWNNSVNNGVTFTPNVTNTYIVTGTNTNGCSDSDQVTVTVNPLPIVNAGQDQSLCLGNMVTLSGSGANYYSWTNNVQNNIPFSPSITQSYSVTGTDNNNCSASDNVLVTVNMNSTATESQTTLDNYTWPVNGQTYSQSGVYTATIPNALGCDSTITLNLSISYSGISELDENINIYPNPTNGNIALEVSSELVGKRYSIRDFSGRTIHDGKITSTQEQIDLQNVARGAYYLSIENSTSVTKLIKQ
jgi:uncharacterized delta-60 repeat protein